MKCKNLGCRNNNLSKPEKSKGENSGKFGN
jgi:hypothetical protein